MREFNLFEKLEDFRDLVEKPDQFVNPLLMMGTDVEAGQSLPRIPEGIQVRAESGQNEEGDTWNGLKDVSTVAPERIYRIEVTTNVGAVNKRFQAVYDMQYARAQSQGKGAWLYVRED
jgi:hypothetical protein